MKRFKILFTALVVIFAVSSAFTTSNKFKDSDIVWFEVDGGVVQTTGGLNQDDPPTGCDLDIGTVCAQSYDISQTTAEMGTGFYDLNSGEETHYQNQKSKTAQ